MAPYYKSKGLNAINLQNRTQNVYEHIAPYVPLQTFFQCSSSTTFSSYELRRLSKCLCLLYGTNELLRTTNGTCIDKKKRPHVTAIIGPVFASAVHSTQCRSYKFDVKCLKFFAH